MPKYLVETPTGYVVINWDGSQPPGEDEIRRLAEGAEPIPSAKPRTPAAIPDPVESYGGMEPDKSVLGFAGNAVKDALVNVPLDLGRAAVDAVRLGVLHDPQLALDAFAGAKGLAQNVSDTYQREGLGGLAQEAVLGAAEGIYNRPATAATMVAPGTVAGAGGRVVRGLSKLVPERNAAALLAKSERIMTPVVKPREVALRNNPDVNIPMTLVREGAELGLTKRGQGIVSEGGRKALRKRNVQRKAEAEAIRKQSGATATAQPAVDAMRDRLQTLAKETQNPQQLGQAAAYIRGVERNPELFSAVVGPGQQIQYIPRDVPIEQLGRIRERLRPANRRMPDYSMGKPEVDEIQLAAQHAYRQQERNLLGSRYMELQDLRRQSIPAERELARAVAREGNKTPRGWRGLLGGGGGMGIGATVGGGLGAATGIPIAPWLGSALGAGVGGSIGSKLMNYLDSAGRHSAQASRLYNKAMQAPQFNATRGALLRVAEPLADATVVEEAMRQALLAQMQEE